MKGTTLDQKRRRRTKPPLPARFRSSPLALSKHHHMQVPAGRRFSAGVPEMVGRRHCRQRPGPVKRTHVRVPGLLGAGDQPWKTRREAYQLVVGGVLRGALGAKGVLDYARWIDDENAAELAYRLLPLARPPML